MTILGVMVVALPLVKILEVIFNQKFNYKAHITQAAKKKVNIALALKRLKSLYFKIAHQLIQGKFVLVFDYASVIWSPRLSMRLIY